MKHFYLGENQLLDWECHSHKYTSCFTSNSKQQIDNAHFISFLNHQFDTNICVNCESGILNAIFPVCDVN